MYSGTGLWIQKYEIWNILWEMWLTRGDEIFTFQSNFGLCLLNHLCWVPINRKRSSYWDIDSLNPDTVTAIHSCVIWGKDAVILPCQSWAILSSHSCLRAHVCWGCQYVLFSSRGLCVCHRGGTWWHFSYSICCFKEKWTELAYNFSLENKIKKIHQCHPTNISSQCQTAHYIAKKEILQHDLIKDFHITCTRTINHP